MFYAFSTPNSVKSFLMFFTTIIFWFYHTHAELAARFQARNRDIHYHTMSSDGTKIKDSLATITMTAKKNK